MKKENNWKVLLTHHFRINIFSDFLVSHHLQLYKYSKYELGIRLIPVDKLNLLADYYKTTVDYLIGRSNIKEPNKEKQGT